MEILKRCDMEHCNAATTPAETRLQLSKSEEEQDVDPTQYRRLIGSLRYLCNTRPDLAFSVGIASRFMERPKVSHLAAVKRILRYVKCTLGCGILFSACDMGRSCELLGYTDSNWCGDKDDQKSTAGYLFMFGKTPISWCSKKEPVVALSSFEAEYIAASMCACQAVWLVNLCKELDSSRNEAVLLLVDNISAINLAKNPIAHGRSQHIEM
ncbi:secreted RxLR effector protein 161-like [Lathyrus oleraceus]|uniref:secreted RxLR effector protein 161-like n=1 Tax=Pisum sativum TaxID=3888 RepID=UPI0021D1A511|nr:secreted RxLR effector protein 161-like [Pisum sativum]